MTDGQTNNTTNCKRMWLGLKKQKDYQRLAVRQTSEDLPGNGEKTAQNSVQSKAISVMTFPAICPSPKSHSTNRQLSSGATDSGLGVTQNRYLYSLPSRGLRKGQQCSHCSATEHWHHCSLPHTESVQTQLCKYRDNSVLLDYFFPHSTTPLL